MYAALWSVLPGPAWLRTVILVVAALIVVAVLFYVVFPWVSHLISINSQDVTVG